MYTPVYMCIHLYPCALVKSVLWDSKEVTIGVYKETAAKRGRAMKRHERSKAHGRTSADTHGHTPFDRNGMERRYAGDGWDISPEGATRHGGVVGEQPKRNMEGNDERKGSPDRKVPDVTGRISFIPKTNKGRRCCRPLFAYCCSSCSVTF